MKVTLLIFATLFAIILLSPPAVQAYGGHGHYRGGIWITPGWGPWWGGYYPYYSTPPLIVERPSLEYYIEPLPEQREEPAYWYYCRKPEGYYPYVKQCPEGWMKVVPTPPSQNREK
jgi:hypothetical protein